MRIAILLLLSLPSLAFSKKCQTLFFESKYVAAVKDYNDNLEEACANAKKDAIWEACVICAGDESRKGVCRLHSSDIVVSDDKTVCTSTAIAKARPCEEPDPERVVHCED